MLNNFYEQKCYLSFSLSVEMTGKRFIELALHVMNRYMHAAKKQKMMHLRSYIFQENMPMKYVHYEILCLSSARTYMYIKLQMTELEHWQRFFDAAIGI